MAKAFLSHSSKDKNLVGKIAKELGRNNCHYDSLTFEAGRETLKEIFKGLGNTDIFVLFISESSLESEWVKKEIRQAEYQLSKQVIDRIFPLIIDKNISHSDKRIPNWIKKPYNIKYFDNEVLILKKIKQFLRESNLKKHAHLQELDQLFVGRHELIQEFERKIINIDNTKPTGIIACSYFEGIGRRTFLKNGLIKTGIIDKWYEPIPISISAKESIEDFIYKLNFVDEVPEVFEYNFTEEDINSKVKLARKIVRSFVDSGEILFVIDEGSIVLPNNTIADWFKEIIKDPEIQNQVSICVISKFRPYVPYVKKLGNVLVFQVNELSMPDTQVFLLQYLRILGKEISADDAKFFMQYLKGIPGQIIYTASLIESVGVNEAKRYIDDIEEFDELRALSIFEFLEDDPLCRQILIALAKFEIISYDLVYKIFGETDEVHRSIQKLYDLTLLFPVSSTHQYLKLNSSISDYINRSNLNLDNKHDTKIKEIATKSLKTPLVLNEYSDYSEFLFNLQNMIKNNIKVPSKYLIPSFILKSIVSEYNDRKYNSVIQLSEKLLENEGKFDSQIIRETKIWLSLAYCRTQNEKFFELIIFFREEDNHNSKIDYYFLLGFYFRNGDKMEKAQEYYLNVLEINENHSRTKRELVNVYLRQGEYMKALNWAKDNYQSFKTNILHIQAYFKCLIRKDDLSDDDIDVLDELLENAEKSFDTKASDILIEMYAEYDFYVSGDIKSAVNALEKALKQNSYNNFAFRSLIEIYSKNHMHDEISNLQKKYPHLIEADL